MIEVLGDSQDFEGKISRVFSNNDFDLRTFK